MEKPAETIILVHGTWATPDPKGRKWYEKPDDRPAQAPFVEKLELELIKRGSTARCWAHCRSGDEIFHWSGKNNWIERANASDRLASYVNKLQDEGWRVHIVAHSHGGNIVLDALPRIRRIGGIPRSWGSIITLGTPFIGSMHPIASGLDKISKMFLTVDWGVWAASIVAVPWFLWFSYHSDPGDIFATRVALFLGGLFVLFALMDFYSLLKTKLSRYSWSSYWNSASNLLDAQASASPLFLASSSSKFVSINSVADEAWQAIRHIRNLENPVKPERGLFGSVISSVHNSIKRRIAIEKVHGAAPWSDQSFFIKAWCIFLQALFVAICLIFIFGSTYDFSISASTIAILPLGWVLLARSFARPPDRRIYSLVWAPVRGLGRVIRGVLSIPNFIANFIVRRKAWRYFQELALGLGDYPYSLPLVSNKPPYLREGAYRYAEMPAGARERALQGRTAWINRHFEDVNETLSKLILTAADLESLLKIIEADETLVHAAYYSDDECIAQIADCISGRSS